MAALTAAEADHDAMRDKGKETRTAIDRKTKSIQSVRILGKAGRKWSFVFKRVLCKVNGYYDSVWYTSKCDDRKNFFISE